MEDYIRLSLETNLFFARIMKEHALFLQAGFVQKNMAWIRKADWFRRQFEDLLHQTVRISNRMISGSVIRSEELVTPYTMSAERKTSELSGIPINSRITRMEEGLECGRISRVSREMVQTVQSLNERAIRLLGGLIAFKEQLLEEVRMCNIYTANYPLLIEHILREARLYRETLEGLMKHKKVCYRNLQNQEMFWNRIMMEHALFIRGLLDPSEEELIQTADDFAWEFEELLAMARKQDVRATQACNAEWRATQDCDAELRATQACDTERCATECCREADENQNHNLTAKSLKETIKLREFKTAGTRGILKCRIQSIILPLLADHVLREANHYIRILESGYEWQEG